MISCKIELGLIWTRNYIISKISKATEVADNNPVKATTTTGATFQINNAKFYVPVVTLSTNANIKFLESIKQRFRTILFWIKYRFEIRTQP